MTNLFQCKHCHFHIIAEELETHECKGIRDCKIDDNNIWASDGERWYPLKRASPKNEHPKTTPDDSTEPKFDYSLV